MDRELSHLSLPSGGNFSELSTNTPSSASKQRHAQQHLYIGWGRGNATYKTTHRKLLSYSLSQTGTGWLYLHGALENQPA